MAHIPIRFPRQVGRCRSALRSTRSVQFLVVSNPNAPQGLNADFQITDPISYSLTTDQSVYQLGQPVQMTYTEVNTSDQPVTVAWEPPAGFSVTHNGTLDMVDALPAIAVLDGTYTFQPGQIRTDTQTWDGIPMSGPYTIANLTGTFVVGYGPEGDGTQLTTTFQIAPPPSYDVVTSVTTDQTEYNLGQPVNLTFTETNDGDQPVAIVTGSAGFEITQNGTAIWNPYYDAPPPTWPTWSTLQPGQSYSQTATWNGLPGSGQLSSLAAPLTVSDDFDPNADTATFQYVAPPTTVLATSLTTDQSVYQLGQPIQLRFTETNVGATAIQVLEGLSSFDIKQDGNEVWNSLFPDNAPDEWPPQSYSWVTLQPGQSFTQTATWNGVPDQLPSGDSSGTFIVSNELDPSAETATFQIVAPPGSLLTTTVTTDKPAYDFGEPAQFTFTETDAGNQPVAVLTGPAAFEITSNGTEVWESTTNEALASSTSWETLQPGQSYTQTITWDGFDGYSSSSPNGAGTFTVSDLLDPNGWSATIQILSTPYTPPSNPPPINPPPVTPADQSAASDSDSNQSPPPPISPPPVTPTPISPPPSNPPPQPPISITSPPSPPIAVTLSTGQSSYTVGQSVPVSVVLTNVTASKLAVNQGQSALT